MRHAAGRVVINEFQAVGGTLTNALGEPCDWIELYNDATQAVALTGWRLTDKTPNPNAWTFPAGAVIAPGEFLLVYASGGGSATVSNALNVPFKLGAEGEYLGLWRPDGAVEFEYAPDYGPQQPNISYGLRPGRTAVALVATGQTYRFQVPSDGSLGTNWTMVGFADDGWVAGVGPLGAQDPPADLAPLIATPLPAGSRAAYVRYPFQVASTGAWEALTLRLQYDDGCVVYLNGTRMLTLNAPSVPDWDSVAPLERPVGTAGDEEAFDLSSALPLLRTGANVLAVHALASADHDLLLGATLTAEAYAPGVDDDRRFFRRPTPGARNVLIEADILPPVTLSHSHGFYTTPFALTLAAEPVGCEIRYTLDGSTPDTAGALLYTNPIPITVTTVLRAHSRCAGREPSPAVTATYLFAADIVRQSTMNQSVVNHATWGPQVPSGLLALPTLSIVTAHTNLYGPTGIYDNPINQGVAWERPASLEWIDPAGGEGFQIDAGLRIYGNVVRAAPKKSFRVLFKARYGPTKLNFPVFDDPTATTSFDTLVLRSGSQDLFVGGGGLSPNGLTDAFVRGTQLALGQPGSRSTFVHLYLNGRYWGLYNPCERPDQSYGPSYFDTPKDQWDAINTGFPTGESRMDGFQAMLAVVGSGMFNVETYQRVSGRHPDGSRHPDYPVHLDVENHAAFVLTQIWAGNNDWTGNNWYTGGARTNGTGWKFFVWDAELCLQNGTPNTSSASGPREIHGTLRQSKEYRLLFADLVQRHCLGLGALTPAAAIARYNALVTNTWPAVPAEAARWGSAATPAAWSNTQASVLQTYLPTRTDTVLAQLRAVALWPAIDAPAFDPPGGVFTGALAVAILSTNAVYYTLDGRDPRAPGTYDLPQGPPVGTAYTGPIALHGSARLKARAHTAAGEWSPLAEALYTGDQIQALRITELMAQPHPPPAGSPFKASDFQFVEVRNTGPRPVDLAHAAFTRGIRFTFPPFVLESGGHAVVVRNAAAFTSRYGQGPRIAGEFEGALANAGERITLRASADGPVLVDFRYGDGRTWPLAAQGAGHSLIPLNGIPQAQRALDYPGNWRASAFMGGSPGRADPAPVRDLVINEIIAHTDYAHPERPEYDSNDWLELYNAGALTVSGTNWYLSDRLSNPAKWPLPPGVTIAPGAWRTFNEADDFNSPPGSGFGLNKSGETLVLAHLPGNGQDRIADAVRFKGLENAWAWGRYPDGADAWFNLTPTSNSANALPGVRVVISEIMYHPPPTASQPLDNTADEFVELLNPGPAPVPLWTDAGPWRLWDGIKYTFPPGTVLAPGEHVLVVAFDPASTAARQLFWNAYGGDPSATRLFGPYENKLSNSGERLALERPQTGDGLNDPPSWVIVDELIYSAYPPWPANAAGGGTSLQRLQGLASGRDPGNWSANFAPSPGGPPTPVAIVAPSDGDAVFLPGSLPVEVWVDPERVAMGATVRLLVDGLPAAETNAPPYRFELPAPGEPGEMELRAERVEDGASTDSTAVRVRIMRIDDDAGALALESAAAELRGHLSGPGTAEVALFWGRTDGGTNPAAWEGGGTLGERAAGGFSARVGALSPGVWHYRCRARGGGATGWSEGTTFTIGDWSAWSRRMKIAFPGYDGTAALTGFPALVALGTNVPGFTYADFAPGGADLRFRAADGTPLPHEVEAWNPAGTSWIWVRIPRLASGSDYVVAYWGRSGATAPSATEASSVWDGAARAVWHFGGEPFGDATAHRTRVENEMTTATNGVVGSGRRFDGAASRLTPDLEPNWYGAHIRHATISLWVRPAAGGNAFGTEDTTAGNRLSIYSARGNWNFAVKGSSRSAFGMQAGAWQMLTLVLRDGQAMAYLNGEGGQSVGPYPAYTPAGTPRIGAMDGAAGRFSGDIDEVRIEAVARSADWIRACYRTVADHAAFTSYELAAPEPADDDEDGLPDSWERRHFGRTDHPDGAPDADPDGDGMRNIEEFIAGTDPTNAASRFVLDIAPGPTSVVVQVETVAAGGPDTPGRVRRYALDYDTTLTGGWVGVSGFTNVWGRGGTESHAEGAGVPGSGFYRGRVWMESW